MKLTITSHAQKQIRKLPKVLQFIIAKRIRKLISIPDLRAEKLTGYKNYYKTRIGVYRIIFIRFTSEIEIVLVGHRKEIYKLLGRTKRE